METIRNQMRNEENILENYIVSRETCMIIPAAHMEYHSIVLERDGLYGVRQTPLEIIKNTCERDWTTFEGRKEIIARETGHVYKTPMVLNVRDMIFAFPTMAINKFECSWVFLHPSIYIKRYKNKGIISFHHGWQILLDISYHTLQTQLERIWELEYIVGHRDHP